MAGAGCPSRAAAVAIAIDVGVQHLGWEPPKNGAVPGESVCVWGGGGVRRRVSGWGLHQAPLKEMARSPAVGGSGWARAQHLPGFGLS